MSWEDTIKKEKFQGPQTRYGAYALDSMPVHLQHLNQVFKWLEIDVKNILANKDASPDKIKGHVEELREIIDRIDKDLINQAKYGDPSGERIDEKWIGNYRAKFEREGNEE